MSLSKDQIKQIRTDIDTALEAVAKKHKLDKLAAGNCTFTGSTFTFKVEGLTQGGETVEEARIATFVYQNKTFTISANARCTKVILTSGGKDYQMPVEMVDEMVERFTK
jgi:hypothetical protein